MTAKRPKGPVFLRYVAPIVETLRELGSSGTAGEVVDRVVERLKISEREQQETTSNGQSRVRNQVNWARFYLSKAGMLDESERGVWTLSHAGRTAALDADSVYASFKAVQRMMPRKPRAAEPEREEHPGALEDDAADQEVAPESDPGDHRQQLLQILRALPPAGFERICQRLLRESGFKAVEVTGRSNDRGIDGKGILEVNPLVTFRVFFQCKRYKAGSRVGSGEVRDFRGAMQGRADKGLFLTTSTFTPEAKKEATREGVDPIELVDEDKLVSMFEDKQLGLRPLKAFTVDAAFFDEYRRR